MICSADTLLKPSLPKRRTFKKQTNEIICQKILKRGEKNNKRKKMRI